MRGLVGCPNHPAMGKTFEARIKNAKNLGKEVRGMTEQEIFEKLKGIIVDKYGSDKASVVKPEATFVEDLGLDSIDTVELVMAIEETFDIKISEEEAQQIKTVGDAVKAIKEKLEKKS